MAPVLQGLFDGLATRSVAVLCPAPLQMFLFWYDLMAQHRNLARPVMRRGARFHVRVGSTCDELATGQFRPLPRAKPKLIS